MICNKCNKEFEDGAKFCTHCGAPAKIVEEKAPTVVSVTPKKGTTKKVVTEKKEENIAPSAVEEKKEEVAAPTAPEAEVQAATKPTRAKKTAKKTVEEKPAQTIAEVKQEAKAEEAPKAEKPSEEPAEKQSDLKEAEKPTEATEKKQSKKAEKKAEKAAPEKEQEKAVAVPKKTEEKLTENAPEKAVKEKKEKAPKSKDRVNFFLLLLTLMCPPYFGVLITICSSAKAPRATQVYGVFTILSFVFAKIKNYILTVIATFCVIMAVLAALVSGAYLVMTELGYDITFITDFVSSYLNF